MGGLSLLHASWYKRAFCSTEPEEMTKQCQALEHAQEAARCTDTATNGPARGSNEAELPHTAPPVVLHSRTRITNT